MDSEKHGSKEAEELSGTLLVNFCGIGNQSVFFFQEFMLGESQVRNIE
jgi:hypothetical protein